MTVYYMGTELEDFTPRSAAAPTTALNGNTRHCLFIDGGSALDTLNFASPSEFWFHAVIRKVVSGTVGTVNPYIVGFFAGATAWIALRYVSAGTLKLSYWTGAAWADLGNFTFAESAINRLDVYIKIGSGGNGQVRVYVNEIPVFNTSALDTTFGGLVTSFTKIRFYAPGTATASTSLRVQEVFVADWNTMGAKLVSRVPDAAGAHNEWTNSDYLRVDEATIDSTFVISDTADQKFTVLCTDFPALGTGESIAAAKISAAMVKDLSGPQNMNFMVRISGTDYHESNQAVPSSIDGLGQIYQTNPATAAIWTVSGLNGTEFGVRSRT